MESITVSYLLKTKIIQLKKKNFIHKFKKTIELKTVWRVPLFLSRNKQLLYSEMYGK